MCNETGRQNSETTQNKIIEIKYKNNGEMATPII
jgi:hypothetical protein